MKTMKGFYFADLILLYPPACKAAKQDVDVLRQASRAFTDVSKATIPSVVFIRWKRYPIETTPVL